MCGIVGYVGTSQAYHFLLEGLRRLEYRGYDSAGIATAEPKSPLQICKSAGRIDNLATEIQKAIPFGTCGIGHTRWATHGPATQTNAHPHVGPEGQVAIVHNGVIENYATLKSHLEQRGYTFHTETDSEVIAYLLEEQLGELELPPGTAPTDRQLQETVRQVLALLRGTYGIGILFHARPDVILAARLGSPLVIGVAEGAHYLASDASP
ncbi:MAG: glutamine--fructose-6-phosphate aminotransferase, partial [Pirellulaceae bacterium]